MRTSSRTLISQIGWLSACILAAVWGPLITFEWRVTWSIIGAFGLIAAFGLQVVNRQRWRLEEHRLQREATSRFNKRVAKLDAMSQAHDAVADSVQQIIDDAHQNGFISLDAGNSHPERGESRVECEIPVQMIAMYDEDENVLDHDDEPSLAYIRNISSSGIGLKHRNRIEAHRVALEVNVSDDKRIKLVATLIWREPRNEDGWFMSGGKLIEATTLLAKETHEEEPTVLAST